MNWKILLSGGAILGFSALASKGLGFLRDRLIIQSFSESSSDIIFAAFRIPDFFFYLLVGATVNVLLIPKLSDFKNAEDQTDLTSSFFWGVSLVFGALCLIGLLLAPWLASIFASGFDAVTQGQVAELSRYIFVSVFLLSISGVFAGVLQFWEKFFIIGLTPLFYMGSIVGGIYFLHQDYGLSSVGIGAIIGASLHLLLHATYYAFKGGKINWAWKKPVSAWRNFTPDFSRRTLNNAAFQINQSIDTWIASFLLVGSVTAFTIGTNLGHFLLSVVGFAVANSAFPALSKLKNEPQKQWSFFKKNLYWAFCTCLPVALICALFPREILQFLFALEGPRLEFTKTVFFWTVISLPFACAIPLCTRLFLANDDTKTPLYATLTSLLIATILAVVLCFYILPKEEAILGLALGNFVANTLSFTIMMGLIYLKFVKNARSGN